MIDSMPFPIVMADARELDGPLSAMGEDEFRAFYERTARPLWAYLSRITGDRQQSDDLLQETYYRFYRAAAKYESESHRRNSLYQIATNLVRDAARRGKRYSEVPIDDDLPAPEHQAAARTDLTRAIGRLEPLQRQLLWLAYAQGASHAEIAAITGVRAISVRTLLLRARRKLAAFLEGSR